VLGKSRRKASVSQNFSGKVDAEAVDNFFRFAERMGGFQTY
jgi:hypothetical protein